MSKRKLLATIEQKDVLFYGDDLTAVKADDGQIYVSVRHMCDALGLTVQSQTRRIQRHNVLSDGLRWVAIMTTHRGEQETYVLRVDLTPLWLSGIDTSRVNPEIKEKLEKFQREAAKVLWEAFQEGRLTQDPTFGELLEQDTPEAQAYKMIQGMLQLARNQLLLRSQMDDHERRLESIEAQLADPGRRITPAQATAVSQAVKSIAMILSKRSGRNEYGGVYGELYRRYEIPEYKQLPAAKFDDCMSWLREWYAQIGEGGVPF